ncbi:hypothetical protein BH24BAC1_BH24BAC1_38460 [soil metagenome]
MREYVERVTRAAVGITVSAATIVGGLVGGVAAGVVGGVALGVAGAAPAAAVQVEQDRVVSPVPAAFTPAVAGGRVSAIAQVGDRMVLGGSFSSATDEAGVTHQRTKILSMDAATGRIDTAFAPSLDGKVEALLPGPTPDTVYVGGGFATVNGSTQRRLALLDLRTGASVPAFRTPAFNGLVKDLVRVDSRLYVAGTFSRVGGQTHRGLVALQASSGAVDPFVGVQVEGHHNYTGATGQAKAATGVYAFDVTPDGRSMVLIGNFTTVDGLNRDQAALLDLTGGSAAVRNDWRTARYTPTCASRAYDFYVRDVDFSPDGSYFVIATTLGARSPALRRR